jgi:hypothetical protein
MSDTLKNQQAIQEALDIIAALRAELVRKDEALRSLVVWLQAAVEIIEYETPKPNCSCHISPPCNDCMDYSRNRETISGANSALAAAALAQGGKDNT